MKLVKVTAKGQLTLPKDLRKAMGINEGDYLEVSIQENCILLRPAAVEQGVDKIKEYCREYVSTPDTLEQARQAMQKVPIEMSEQVRKLREEEE